MRTTRSKLAAMFAVFSLSACTTVDVRTDYDHSAAFGTYKTYSIAPGPDGVKLPLYCEMTLRKTIHSELAARGVAEATGNQADLAIVWHLFLASKTSAQERRDPEIGGDWAYAYGYYTSWTGAPNNFSNATPRPDGTLILDVVDMHTQKLVFRGTGTAVAMGPERGAENIEKAVKKMVATLPVRR